MIGISVYQLLIQKFPLKTTKFFGSKEIGTEEVLLAKLEVTLAINYFPPNEIENFSWDVLILHTKPITNGIIYGPPNQSKFLDIFGENLAKPNTSYREISFLGDFKIHLFESERYAPINLPIITKT